jgi:hypothetical protein
MERFKKGFIVCYWYASGNMYSISDQICEQYCGSEKTARLRNTDTAHLFEELFAQAEQVRAAMNMRMWLP